MPLGPISASDRGRCTWQRSQATTCVTSVFFEGVRGRALRVRSAAFLSASRLWRQSQKTSTASAVTSRYFMPASGRLQAQNANRRSPAAAGPSPGTAHEWLSGHASPVGHARAANRRTSARQAPKILFCGSTSRSDLVHKVFRQTASPPARWQKAVQNPVSYTHLRAHETDSYLVCRLLLEKKKN